MRRRAAFDPDLAQGRSPAVPGRLGNGVEVPAGDFFLQVGFRLVGVDIGDAVAHTDLFSAGREEDAALVFGLLHKGDRTVEGDPGIGVQAREAFVADEGTVTFQAEVAVAVQVPETQPGALLGVKDDFRDTAALGRGETDAAALETRAVLVGRVFLAVIDLPGRGPGAVPATLHQGQETEYGLQAVGGQGQRIVGDLVIQHIGPQRRPADDLIGNLHRGARGLQNAHATDRRIDFGEDIIRLAPRHEQGQGCRPAKEMFHILFLRLDTIWAGKT